MQTNWNPSECYNLAKSYLSEDKINDLKHHILSVPWKFSLCRYHIDEYRRFIGYPTNAGINKELIESVKKIIEMSAGSEVGKEFRIILFFAEAHVIAFAQALHSTADIIAHILKIILDLDFKNKQINFINTLEIMKRQQIAIEVYNKAHGLRNSKEFMYLNAFVNTIKHRRLIDMPYHINLKSGQEFHGLRINSFKYGNDKNKEIPYDSKWVDGFICNDFEELSNTIGEVGVELNKHMKLFCTTEL